MAEIKNMPGGCCCGGVYNWHGNAFGSAPGKLSNSLYLDASHQNPGECNGNGVCTSLDVGDVIFIIDPVKHISAGQHALRAFGGAEQVFWIRAGNNADHPDFAENPIGTWYDVVKLLVTNDPDNSPLSIHYPRTGSLLQYNFEYPPSYFQDPLNGFVWTPVTPLVKPPGKTLHEMVASASAASSHRTQLSSSTGFLSGSGILTDASARHSSGWHVAMGSDGPGFAYIESDGAAPIASGSAFGGLGGWRGDSTILKSYPGSYELIANGRGLEAAEYPGWNGNIADAPLDSLTVVPVDSFWTFHAGYVYWLENPEKFARFKGFGSHGFPKGFGLTAPEIKWYAPPESPDKPKQTINALPGQRVFALGHVWLEPQEEQSVKFTYGECQAVLLTLTDDFRTTSNTADSFFEYPAEVFAGPSGSAFTVSHRTDRVKTMDYQSGFTQLLPDYVDQLVVFCHFQPNTKMHCYGQYLWGDGSDTGNIMIVTYSKIDYYITSPPLKILPSQGPIDFKWWGGGPYYQLTGGDFAAGTQYYDSPQTEQVLDSTHTIAVIVAGIEIKSTELFRADEVDRYRAPAMLYNDKYVWFEKVYSVEPTATTPGVASGWKLHLENGGTLETESPGPGTSIPLPLCVGSSKDYFFVTGFYLSDQLSKTGSSNYPDTWMFSYDLSVQVPYVWQPDQGTTDIDNPANWPIREWRSSASSGYNCDPVGDIGAFDFCSNVSDFGKMGSQPSASKYPSRVPV